MGNVTKKVPLTNVLTFENAAVPNRLLAEVGSMHSGEKAVFMHRLKDLLREHLCNLKNVKKCDAVIYDGHAVIKALPEPEYTDKIFKYMYSKFKNQILTTTERDLHNEDWQ